MSPLYVAPRQVKLRVEDYLLLDGSGAFDAYGKTELIEGDVYSMNAQHRAHARTKSRLHVLIAAALSESELEAIVEGSVAMAPNNAPEPDIVVTDAADGDGLIPIESVRLIVEVSDATIAFDLGAKARVYAAASVPEYWVADITGKLVHQMWAPAGDEYLERRAVPFGETIAAVTVPALAVETTGL